MTLTSWSLYQVRDFETSIAKAQQIIDLDRTNFQGHLQIGNALLEVGATERALAELRKSAELMPTSGLAPSILCFALVAAGLRSEAEQIRAEMIATAKKDYMKEYFLAMAHVALGYSDEAMDYLDKAAAERDPWMVWFGTEAKLDPLRDNPRFAKIFQSTNNPLAFR
jgi:tetratricopeptide (TPR) repeat protein